VGDKGCLRRVPYSEGPPSVPLPVLGRDPTLRQHIVLAALSVVALQ